MSEKKENEKIVNEFIKEVSQTAKEVISIYTKSNAIEDGLQILVHATEGLSELVSQAGFRVPVYFTSGVVDYCNVPECLDGLQDFRGRVRNVLYLASMEAQRMKKDNDYVGKFTVHFLMNPSFYKDVVLYIAFDEFEGFTVMLPEDY